MQAQPLYEHILVAVDAHGLARDALVRAAELSKELGAKLDLVHAVEMPRPIWIGIGADELAAMRAATLRTARERVFEYVEPTLTEMGVEGAPADLLHVAEGPPAHVILDRAQEQDADLVVLGKHEKKHLFDFGGTARAVLPRAACPVWTESATVEPVRRILVPIDFSEHSKLALDHAVTVASKFGASIRVVHGYAPPEFAYANVEAVPGPTYVVDQDRGAAKEELARWMGDVEWGELDVTSEVVEGDIVRNLIKASKDTDLVVMGTHGRTGLARFLLGSVAYAVLKHAEVPVLVIPSPDRKWLLGETVATQPAHTSVVPPLSLA